ncbi:acetyltransferase [Phlyctema vagabunda]|uniref:Acetyltransferase n=1 Tax=Phlyctema vagabunda TaxID=108571 RepID=A0ABR4P2R9_9HELO
MSLQTTPLWTEVEDHRSTTSAHTTIRSNAFPLILRTPLPEDIAGLTEVMMNPENTGSDLSISKMTPSEINDLVSKWMNLTDPLQHLNMVILRHGKVIGVTGLGWIGSAKDKGLSSNDHDLVGVVGVLLNPDMRRQGMAFDVLKIAIDYGFRQLKMLQITLGTSSKNLPMRGLMEKKFEMPATVEEPDRFGNDLVWKIDQQDWLATAYDSHDA